MQAKDNKVDPRIEELEKKLKEIKTDQLKPEKTVNQPEMDLPELLNGDARELKFQEGFKFADKFHVKHKPEKSFLVTIRFSNGTMKTFVIVSKDELFKFRSRHYYLRYENGWYDLNHKMWHLDFFDDFVSPIEREVVQDGDKEYFKVKPSNIATLLKMEYVKALTSNDLSKWLKMTLLIVFVVLLMALVNAYFSYHADKIIQQVAQQVTSLVPAK